MMELTANDDLWYEVHKHSMPSRHVTLNRDNVPMFEDWCNVCVKHKDRPRCRARRDIRRMWPQGPLCVICMYWELPLGTDIDEAVAQVMATVKHRNEVRGDAL